MLEKEKIGRAVGHTIPHYRVRQADPAGAPHGGRVKGDEFEVFRPNTPVRGAKSQGRLVPPGHDETGRPERDGNNRPGRGRWNESQPEAAPRENASAPTSDKPEPPQQGGRDEQPPSRLRTHGPQRRQGQVPRGTGTGVTTEPSPKPEQGAAPDSAAGTRNRGTEEEPRRDPSTPTARPEPPTARPAEHGQPNPPSVSPGQAGANSEKPGQGKGQPAKPKSKKAGKAKPAPAEPEGSDAEKPKPEQPDSGKQN